MAASTRTVAVPASPAISAPVKKESEDCTEPASPSEPIPSTYILALAESGNAACNSICAPVTLGVNVLIGRLFW